MRRDCRSQTYSSVVCLACRLFFFVDFHFYAYFKISNIKPYFPTFPHHFTAMPNTNSYAAQETASFTWVIEKFSSCNEWSYCKEFCMPNNECIKYKMELFPNASNKFIHNCVLIRTLFGSCRNDHDEAQCKISIIDAGGKKCHTTQGQVIHSLGSNSYLTHVIIWRPYLFDKANGLLCNDNLTIHCEIFYGGKMSNKNESLKCVECGGSSDELYDHKTMSDNYETLLENSKLSDVVIVVGESGKEKEFHLHKAILGARSPVFAAMFEANFEEAKQNRVSISDVSVEVFEVMIQYIYTGKIPSMQKYATEMLSVSDKYQLESLKQICEQSLCINLTTESVAEIVSLADMHNSGELKQKCIEYINKNTAEVMASEGWKCMIKQNRIELLNELYQDLAKSVKSTTIK